MAKKLTVEPIYPREEYSCLYVESINDVIEIANFVGDSFTVSIVSGYPVIVVKQTKDITVAFEFRVTPGCCIINTGKRAFCERFIVESENMWEIYREVNHD